MAYALAIWCASSGQRGSALASLHDRTRGAPRLNFLQPAWQRTLFCLVTVAVYSGSAVQLIVQGAFVPMLAALVAGGLIGRILRPWAARQPLLFTAALLILGLAAQQGLSTSACQLTDMLLCGGIIASLWPSGGGKKWRAFTAGTRRLTRRWSRAIPIG